MSPSSLTINPMRRAELDIGIGWAADEGWNPGLHDADSFHASDPAGFLIARLGNEPIGMISAVRYGDRFGFLGFYIVHPAYRGRGYGLALWKAAMQRLSGRLVGLDGVVAQQANYRKSGFVLAYNNVRYEGQPDVPAASADASVRPLSSVAFSDLLRYDTGFFPTARETFLTAWVAQRDSGALALIRDGNLAGYGVIRPCRVGFKVGPLFADDAAGAEHLLCALVRQAPRGSTVQLDVPAINRAGVALASSFGMRPVFETARMYTGPAPGLPVDNIFGVTTFELG